MTENLTLSSRDGLSLEAEWDRPATSRATVVLCHPHPKMGGTMNAPLLEAVRDRLLTSGWDVLRFNFRGIGTSEGTSGVGIDEVADALGAIDLARDRSDNPIAVGGWSFGGAVALRAASQDPQLAACVAIAPAVVPKPDITAGAPAPDDFSFKGPALVVCGINDDQVSPAACRGWAAAVGATYEEMRGANHFFWGKYEALGGTVAEFLDRALET